MAPPVVTAFDGAGVAGTTFPFAIIDVYVDPFLQGMKPQTRNFLGTTTADANGDWRLGGDIAAKFPGLWVTAMATDPDTMTTSDACWTEDAMQLPGTLLSDADLDGLPDAYESLNGLDPNNFWDAWEDPDGNGKTHVQDYLGPVIARPKAAFTSDLSSGIAPLTVAFTDESLNGPIAWQWDFESDGIVDSALQHPVFEYELPGVYTVTLEVTNSSGADTVIREDLIVVEQPPTMATLETDVLGGGTVALTPEGGYYPIGTEVEAEAQAVMGWLFDHWEGDVPTGGETENPLTMTMDTDKSLTVVFVEVDEYTLTMEVVGQGTTIPPAGDNVYDVGAAVALLATPADGYRFFRWEEDIFTTDNPTALVMDNPKYIRAVFWPFVTEVTGTVLNARNDAPVEGVLVEASAPGKDGPKAMASDTTDAEGRFQLSIAPSTTGLVLTCTRSEFLPQVLEYEMPPYEPVGVRLDPLGVMQPAQPFVYSSPLGVYAEWDPNPEYNLKGYTLWRTPTDSEGTPQGSAVQLFATPQEGGEYFDDTAEQGAFYTYQVQAMSAADRPSALSAPSAPVQAKVVAMFMPEVNAPGVPSPATWDLTPEDPADEDWVRIPIAAACAYDLSSAGMQVVSRLPNNLLALDDAQTLEVRNTAITQEAALAATVPAPGEVHVTSPEPGFELYGNGAIVELYVQKRALAGTGALAARGKSRHFGP